MGLYYIYCYQHVIILVTLFSAGLGEPSCPYTWFKPADNSSGNCTCGDSVRNRVFCIEDQRAVGILLSYCMTYDNTSNETVLGSCPFFPITNIMDGYVLLPKYVGELNQAVCHHANREGRLCGECRSGYAPNALSYSHECIECNANPAGQWIFFFVYQFVPVTVFFFIVLIFKLEVISGPLTAFVFFAQVYSSPESIRLIRLLVRQASSLDTNSLFNFFRICVTVYGVWNLDFGRAFLPDICLGEGVTTIEAVALEFIEPLYLILLTALTFAVIELYGRGFKPIVVVWKPFVACASKFRKKWKITDSVIHTMATFLLLSYTKLVVVSIRILNGVFLYNIDGKEIAILPYYSTENDYFHGEHAAFATLAILTLGTLVAIPPIVLLLYPLKKFHVCMSAFCHPRLQYGLRTFVESFQGSYKDGSSSRFDLRYTAGWYFLLRIFVAVGDIDNAFSPHFGRESVAITLLITAVCFAFLQPYKRYSLNVVDTFHFVVLSLIYWLVLNDVFSTLLNRGNKALGVIAFLSVLPCVYLALLTLHWVWFTKKFPQRFFKWLRKTSTRIQHSNSLSLSTNAKYSSIQTPLTADYCDASFADRLVNPTSYDDLIPSRQKVYARQQTVSTNAGTSREPSFSQASSSPTIHEEEMSANLPQKLPTTYTSVESEDSGREVEQDRESL